MATRNLKTEIEWYVITRVRDMRMEQGKSQEDLAERLDVSKSFIGNIESPLRREKYNFNHLNKLAKLLNCSPKEFWPDKPL